MHPVANARMYSATPAVKAAWKELLRWVLARAQLPWEVIDYDAPQALSVLWARDDLGVAMMCGLPFARRDPRPVLVAAPIPSPARYAGRAVYFTDIVVRANSPFQTLEDTFGGAIGYTLADSLSGGVALARHLDKFRTPQRPRLYQKSVGNLIHARGVIEALVRGEIDAGPLDSYYHDLLRHNDAAFAAQVRTVASTAALPIPPLVATGPLTAGQLQGLRGAFAATRDTPEIRPLMERLLLAGFAFPDAHDYDVLPPLDRTAAGAFEEL